MFVFDGGVMRNHLVPDNCDLAINYLSHSFRRVSDMQMQEAFPGGPKMSPPIEQRRLVQHFLCLSQAEY
jgi:hypothetical protein